mmetsp:Transcript_12854/g.11386  ORF Transcript_12854/g.11386 Transcript_12854/m.11386 type:complete len:229 (+) Transcript_12854:297-983(+)
MKRNSPSFKPKRQMDQGYPQRGRPFTHFIALPVQNKDMCKKLVDFQYKVESFDRGRSIFEQWYVEESTFHFTFCMLPLENTEQVEKAAQVFEDLQPEIEEFLEEKDFKLTLKGIGQFPMHQRPKESNVLFVKLAINEHFDTLNQLRRLILDRMIREEILYENEVFDQVFHLTLVKSSRLKNVTRGFVSQPLLHEFGKEHFGTFKPNKLSIYRRNIEKGKYISVKDIKI